MKPAKKTGSPTLSRRFAVAKRKTDKTVAEKRRRHRAYIKAEAIADSVLKLYAASGDGLKTHYGAWCRGSIIDLIQKHLLGEASAK